MSVSLDNPADAAHTAGGRPAAAWAVGRVLFLALGVVAWAAIFVLPLLTLYAGAGTESPPASSAPPQGPGGESGETPWAAGSAGWMRSIGLAAAIAALAVILGYVPGRLIGTADLFSARAGRGHTRQVMLLLLLLAPLLLPSYVLYYAWALLLSPTSALGGYLCARPEAARFAGTLTSAAVLMLWHWPLAAMLIAQGWRNIDGEVMEIARLDAGGVRRFLAVTLPLLGGAMGLAFGLCFVLALSEFTTFHLSGLRTVGTQLALLFDQTHDERLVARAAWPLFVPAAAVALVLWKRMFWNPQPQEGAWAVRADLKERRRGWVVLVWLMGISFLAPLALLAFHLREASAVRDFYRLHRDELAWSACIAAAAAGVSLWIASAAMGIGARAGARRGGYVAAAPKGLSALMHVTILLAMLLPPSLLAVSLLRLMAWLDLPSALRQSWVVVSAGLVMRYAGLSVIVLGFTRAGENRHLSEMAAADGASPGQAWLHVHLPRLWPLPAGALLLGVMFGLTEVPSTLVLLPPGVPNFAQTLMNQMHYLRDQHVIVSCLALIAAYAVLAVLVVAILSRLIRRAV